MFSYRFRKLVPRCRIPLAGTVPASPALRRGELRQRFIPRHCSSACNRPMVQALSRQDGSAPRDRTARAWPPHCPGARRAPPAVFPRLRPGWQRLCRRTALPTPPQSEADPLELVTQRIGDHPVCRPSGVYGSEWVVLPDPGPGQLDQRQRDGERDSRIDITFSFDLLLLG